MTKKTLTFLIGLALFFFVGINFALAQGSGDSNEPDTKGPSGLIQFDNPFRVGDTLYDLVSTIVNDIILPVGGVVAVIAFIFSGFLYVTAQGNETKLKKANQALLNTAIGTALLLGAWVFALVIKNTIDKLVQ